MMELEPTDAFKQVTYLLCALGAQVNASNPEAFEHNMQEIFKKAEQDGVGDEIMTIVWNAVRENETLPK